MGFKNVSHEIAEIAKGYDYQQPPDIIIKFQEMVAYLLRLLKDILSFLKLPDVASDSHGVANILQVLVIAAGVVAAIIILILVAIRLRKLEAERKISLASLVVAESSLDSRGWLTLGEELKGKKEYREACRAVYMSVLHLLDERQIMTFSATKTNYEYFYALKRLSKVAQSFRNLADLVEYIWFGDREATASEYEECRKLATLMEEGLPQAKKKTAGAASE